MSQKIVENSSNSLILMSIHSTSMAIECKRVDRSSTRRGECVSGYY